MEVIEAREPEPIILTGQERINGNITPKRMFFVKYNDGTGYIYLENGEYLRLTPIKLKVIELLIEALAKGITYIYGRDLLYRAGSEQFYLSNLFNSCPNWKNFIESTSRGYYRLRLYANSTYEDYIQSLIKKSAA